MDAPVLTRVLMHPPSRAVTNPPRTATLRKKMEEIIQGTIAGAFAGQHISVALIGTLLRDLVQRQIMSLDEAKALIARTQALFGNYADNVTDVQMRDQVRDTVANMFDRVLENLEVP